MFASEQRSPGPSLRAVPWGIRTSSNASPNYPTNALPVPGPGAATPRGSMMNGRSPTINTRSPAMQSTRSPAMSARSPAMSTYSQAMSPAVSPAPSQHHSHHGDDVWATPVPVPNASLSPNPHQHQIVPASPIHSHTHTLSPRSVSGGSQAPGRMSRAGSTNGGGDPGGHASANPSRRNSGFYTFANPEERASMMNRTPAMSPAVSRAPSHSHQDTWLSPNSAQPSPHMGSNSGAVIHPRSPISQKSGRSLAPSAAGMSRAPSASQSARSGGNQTIGAHFLNQVHAGAFDEPPMNRSAVVSPAMSPALSTRSQQFEGGWMGHSHSHSHSHTNAHGTPRSAASATPRSPYQQHLEDGWPAPAPSAHGTPRSAASATPRSPYQQHLEDGWPAPAPTAHGTPRSAASATPRSPYKQHPDDGWPARAPSAHGTPRSAASATPRTPYQQNLDDGWSPAPGTPRSMAPGTPRSPMSTRSMAPSHAGVSRAGSVRSNRHSGVFITINHDDEGQATVNIDVPTGMEDGADDVTIKVVSPTLSDGSRPLRNSDEGGNGAFEQQYEHAYEHDHGYDHAHEHEHEHEQDGEYPPNYDQYDHHDHHDHHDHDLDDYDDAHDPAPDSPEAANAGIVTTYEPETNDPAYHYRRYLQQKHEAMAQQRAELIASGVDPNDIDDESETLDGNEGALVRRPEESQMQLTRIEMNGMFHPIELSPVQKQSFREAMKKGITTSYPNEQGRKVVLKPPEEPMLALMPPEPASPQPPPKPVWDPNKEDGGLFD